MPEFSIKNGNMIVNLVMADSFEDAETLFGEGNVIEGAIQMRSTWDEENGQWVEPVILEDIEFETPPDPTKVEGYIEPETDPALAE